MSCQKISNNAPAQVRGVHQEPREPGPGRACALHLGAPVGAVPHRVLHTHPGRGQDTGQ